MVAGKLFRLIDQRSWDAVRRASDMDEESIDLQLVSPMPELLSHWFPAADAAALARHVNAAIAEMCGSRPRRFIGIGMVPLQDPGRAARQLDEVKSLGLQGVEIGTHINGVPLGDASLDEFYAAAEEAGLAVMIHPLHPAGLERIGGRPELSAAAAFPLETALAATSLLTRGVPTRFPRLRLLISHGGGALPFILPRLRHARSLGGLFEAIFPDDPGRMAQAMFYDTIVYDARCLRFIADTIGTHGLVIGSDYPFSIKQPRPAHFACEALGVPIDFFEANARRLLGPATLIAEGTKATAVGSV
jgi:aminocarboxymuconate-semialdehyde decarboxylase